MEITIQESDARLRNLLNLYRNVELIHPMVSSFCQVSENKEAFQRCLTHEYDLLCGRSQDLSHDDISIYQKAFVILMEKEEDHIGAIEIYANEILGLSSEKPANGLQILKTAVQARGLIQNSRIIHSLYEQFNKHSLMSLLLNQRPTELGLPSHP